MRRKSVRQSVGEPCNHSIFSFGPAGIVTSTAIYGCLTDLNDHLGDERGEVMEDPRKLTGLALIGMLALTACGGTRRAGAV